MKQKPPEMCGRASQDLAETIARFDRHKKPCGNMRAVAADLARAQKFRLPKNGALLAATIDQKREWIETYAALPYESTALEFEFELATPDWTDAYEIVLVLTQVDSQAPISMSAMLRTKGRGAFVSIGPRVEFSAADGWCRGSSTETSGGDSQISKLEGVFLGIVAEFLAALACSNVRVEDGPPPTARWFNTRKSAFRPLYRYKELVITTQGAKAAEESKGGSHASPRIHLRRGHIRRLEGRTIWVNACVVGRKEQGMLHKHYRLEGKK